MPIIIDNFQVNRHQPIDNRFVVGTSSFYKTRDEIVYKYPGLRIWDMNTPSGPFYWTGATWSSENAIGVTVDGTPNTNNFIPKFSSSSTTILSKSLLYDNASSLGIGIIGSNINPNILGGSTNGGLHVVGNIRAGLNSEGLFIGNGANLTNINASNITSGTLDINRLPSAITRGGVVNIQYVLYSLNGSISWQPTSLLTTQQSTNSDNVKITDDLSSTSPAYISFSSQLSGYNPIKVSSSRLQYIPSNGQLLLSNGTVNEPSYSFINSSNTGIFYNTNGLNLSFNGLERLRVDTNGIKTTDGNVTTPSISFIGDTNTGIYRIGEDSIGITTNGVNKITISNNSTSISTNTGQRILADTEVTTFGIFNTNQPSILGSSVGNNIVLRTMSTAGGTSNSVSIKDYALRGSNGSDWQTFRVHNGITVDSSFGTPGVVNGTLTFWERDPNLREHYFGSEDKKTLTINSQSNPFVRVDGDVRGNTISGNWIATNTEAVNPILDTKVMTPRATKTAITAIKSTSSVMTYNNNTFVDWQHGLGGIPDFVSVSFICKVVDGGYAVGDILQVSPTSEASGLNEGYSLRKSLTSVRLRIGNGAGKTVANTQSGDPGEIFLSGVNWNLQITAYKF